MEEQPTRRYRMELQYDGTGLHGWAKQAGLLTVQGCLEEAFATVLGQVPVMQVAGRTDAGVHARRQVVSLDLPRKVDVERLRASLNALTPAGIAILGLFPAAWDFDARRDAVSRTYRYFIFLGPVRSPFWARYSWHIPYALDLAAMRGAAAAVVGKHNLRAFTPAETEHVYFERQVFRCRWVRKARTCIYLEIEAEAFLRHMVRVLVGTMVEVGMRKRSLSSFLELLKGSPRLAAGPTAPACGLFLWDVRYKRR